MLESQGVRRDEEGDKGSSRDRDRAGGAASWYPEIPAPTGSVAPASGPTCASSCLLCPPGRPWCPQIPGYGGKGAPPAAAARGQAFPSGAPWPGPHSREPSKAPSSAPHAAAAHSGDGPPLSPKAARPSTPYLRPCSRPMTEVPKQVRPPPGPGLSPRGQSGAPRVYGRPRSGPPKLQFQVSGDRDLPEMARSLLPRTHCPGSVSAPAPVFLCLACQHTGTRTRTHTHALMYTLMHAHVCTHTCTDKNMHVHTHRHEHRYRHTHAHRRAYTHALTHMRSHALVRCVRPNAHAHTHTHRRTQSLLLLHGSRQLGQCSGGRAE